LFKEEGKQEDEWKEEEGLKVRELGKRMIPDSGGRGGSEDGLEGNPERLNDCCMGVSQYHSSGTELGTSGAGRLSVQAMMGKTGGEQRGKGRRSIAWTVTKRFDDTEGIQLSEVATWSENIKSTRIHTVA
jgi:hypothetical protein